MFLFALDSLFMLAKRALAHRMAVTGALQRSLAASINVDLVQRCSRAPCAHLVARRAPSCLFRRAVRELVHRTLVRR